MSKGVMQAIQPIMGAGELGLGIATMNPMLMGMGGMQLAGGLTKALMPQQQGARPSGPPSGLSLTPPVPNLQGILGAGGGGMPGGGLSVGGSFGSPTGMGGGQSLFGSLGSGLSTIGSGIESGLSTATSDLGSMLSSILSSIGSAI